jgi:TDG/mug DNA glycosylase family protein
MTKRPTKHDLLAAKGRRLPDVIGPRLTVLFCGINPGLYSAAVGHHFARPGNRFWAALHRAGFTSEVLTPGENRRLLNVRCGLTDIVSRATAKADELDTLELVAGRRRLERKVKRFRPRWLAVLGIGAYRIAFGRPKATLGLQAERIGDARLWVLPNPSGLNASHKPADLARAFRHLRLAAGATRQRAQ